MNDKVATLLIPPEVLALGPWVLGDAHACVRGAVEGMLNPPFHRPLGAVVRTHERQHERGIEVCAYVEVEP